MALVVKNPPANAGHVREKNSSGSLQRDHEAARCTDWQRRLPYSSQQRCRRVHLALIIWPSRMNQPWPASISVAASLPISSCAEPARPSSDLTARKAAEPILRDSGHRCTDRKVDVNLHRPDLTERSEQREGGR